MKVVQSYILNLCDVMQASSTSSHRLDPFFHQQASSLDSTVENVSRYWAESCRVSPGQIVDVVLNPSTILTTSLHH